MKIKKILLLLLIALLTAVSVSIIALHSYKKDQQKLQLAQSLLYEDKIAEATELFSRLEKSSWVKKQARLGSIITAILSNNTSNNIPLPEKDTINIYDYHLLSLLKRQLAAAAFKQCIQLAQVGRFYEIEAADLYYSASLLEKGETDKAYHYYSGLSEKLKNTPLGNRLKETFALLHAGAQSIVRDRSGELVGTIGKNGEFKFYRPGYRSLVQSVVLQEIINSVIPKGLRLSLDLELSRLALESLGKNRGSIVLIKPDTGEILAAVSDKRTGKKMGSTSSPAFEQMLEPASISKLITVTAAFRNNLDPDDEIAGMTCRGAKRYSGKILYCPAAQGKLYGLEHALAVSCNTAFADLGVKVGWEKMLTELRLFGFDSELKNPFPLGKIIINTGDNRALADLAIGLENTVLTPVHAALLASVFANNGSWIYPQLLYASDGYTGLSPRKIKRFKGTKILDEEWLPPIREAMWGVTRFGGTAAFIAPTGFQVHMKTGTGGSYKKGYHINYIGCGPEDIANMAFSVRVTNKRTSYQARRAGYDTTRQLLIRLQRNRFISSF